MFGGGGRRKSHRAHSRPDLFGFNHVILTEERTRAGGRQLAPPITLTTSLSWSYNCSQLREESWRLPDEPWDINVDSAHHPVDHSITCNEPHPGEHWAYSIVMNYAVMTYQLPQWGGIGRAKLVAS